MPTLSHMLWFDTEAEEAVNHYLDVFKEGKIHNVARGNENKVFTISFELFGAQYTALNGGPHFKFNEAVSVMIICDGQEEVDKYWDALIAFGGTPGNCGWLKDKFGLSWQIIPKQLGEYLGNPDPAKADRAMKAMLGMSKIIVKELQEAVA